jgi:hypothetical protein
VILRYGSRKRLVFPFTVTDADGQPVTLSGVVVSLLPHGQRSPDASTAWSTPVEYASGEATVPLAHPSAAQSDWILVPAPGKTLWARPADDSDETEPVQIERIDVF